mmetsp:Transcript_26391/g.84912  ORF Transcript_26391/g.84912 Transcript_26391/m.84912 type:complete len:683 (-) Transcript_26391:239-2287(-)
MCSLVTLAVAAVALRAGPIPALPRPVTLAADARVKHVAAVALHPLQPVVARPSGLSGLRCGRCGRPVLSAAPAKKVKTPWKTLLSLCKPDAAPLVTAFVCLAVAASGDALLPALQGAALNAALGLGTDAAGSLAQLRPALVRLAAVGLGTAVFTGIRGFCFWVCGARLVARLRATLFDALLAQPQAFHDEQGPGDLSTRLATDCVKLGDVLSLNVNIVLRQVLQSLAGMAVVLRLSGRLALLVVAGVLLRSLFAHFYSMAARRLSQAQQDRLAASSGVAEQCFSLIKLVRSHGSQRSERRRYGQQLDGLLRLQTEYGAIYGCSRVFNGAVNAALNVAVLAGGAALVAAGVLPREALTSFVLYVAFISDASSDVLDQWSRIQEALGAATEVFDYLEPRALDLSNTTAPQPAPQPADADAAASPPPPLPLSSGSSGSPRGSLEFVDVDFAYPSRQSRPVLRSLSLRVPAGRRTAILGGSGSGKSTLFALALRFYVPSSGRVLLDGADVARMGEADLRRRTAWVQQEPPLFPNITIRDNIAYGLADCSMDAVEEAAREANAFDFIAALPSGFETRIGAAGASLSGGQKQRIALARALVRDPALLLLDEATSALDNESERIVQAALDELMAKQKRTTITIAHRLSTIRNADKIAVVRRGKVVEQGTHDELLQIGPGGVYFDLVGQQ